MKDYASLAQDELDRVDSISESDLVAVIKNQRIERHLKRANIYALLSISQEVNAFNNQMHEDWGNTPFAQQ